MPTRSLDQILSRSHKAYSSILHKIEGAVLRGMLPFFMRRGGREVGAGQSESTRRRRLSPHRLYPSRELGYK